MRFLPEDNVFEAEDSARLFSAEMELLQDKRNQVFHIVFPEGTFTPEQTVALTEAAKLKKTTLMKPFETFLFAAQDAESPVSLLQNIPNLLQVITVGAWHHQQYITFKDTPDIL